MHRRGQEDSYRLAYLFSLSPPFLPLSFPPSLLPLSTSSLPCPLSLPMTILYLVKKVLWGAGWGLGHIWGRMITTHSRRLIPNLWMCISRRGSEQDQTGRINSCISIIVFLKTTVFKGFIFCLELKSILSCYLQNLEGGTSWVFWLWLIPDEVSFVICSTPVIRSLPSLWGEGETEWRIRKPKEKSKRNW